MLPDKLKELEAARAKIASLEKSIEVELKSELSALPAKYGFQSVADFVAAVTKAAAVRRGRKPGNAKPAVTAPAVKPVVAPVVAPAAKPAAKLVAKPAVKPAAGVKKKRRKRAVITEAMRAEVKKMSAAGKTGKEIAKAVGVSLPSVQNIKKALGLVKKR
jgi:hypothetical protein